MFIARFFPGQYLYKHEAETLASKGPEFRSFAHRLPNPNAIFFGSLGVFTPSCGINLSGMNFSGSGYSLGSRRSSLSFFVSYTIRKLEMKCLVDVGKRRRTIDSEGWSFLLG